MELRRYLHLIRRRLALVLVTMVVGAAIGYMTTPRLALYSAQSEIYVGSRQLAQDPTQLFALPGLNQVVATFADMIDSPVIAQKAIAATKVPRSAGQVAAETRASVVASTNLITVTVTDPDPVIAEHLATGISNAFVAQVQAYEPGGNASPGALPTEPAYVFQDAYLPTVPLGNGLKRKVLLGGLFGMLVSVLVVLLLDYLDISVKGPEDLEKRLDLPVLGTVPFRRSLPKEPSPLEVVPQSVLIGRTRV
ncbi:MAG: YveK family protein [Acidimicrobiales bacterium]